MNKKNICLIPARGGSKRIPKKNIKEFNGKPLIAWSIECALLSKLFKDVYVSTDDLEIASIAKKYGAKIPFIRPKELSDDYSKDEDVRNHFIKWMDDSKIECNHLCYLYATAPFITTETLNSCYELLINTNSYLVMTVTKFPYPVQRALKKDAYDNLSFMWEEFKNYRSQDLPELFHDAGQCYFFNLNNKIKLGSRIGFELPRHQCQDIDTMEDFAFAEKLFLHAKTIL